MCKFYLVLTVPTENEFMEELSSEPSHVFASSLCKMMIGKNWQHATLPLPDDESNEDATDVALDVPVGVTIDGRIGGNSEALSSNESNRVFLSLLLDLVPTLEVEDCGESDLLTCSAIFFAETSAATLFGLFTGDVFRACVVRATFTGAIEGGNGFRRSARVITFVARTSVTQELDEWVPVESRLENVAGSFVSADRLE